MSEPGIVKRRYVDLGWGQVHLAEAGSGPRVLLFHQTPRSWDEYREVLPLLAQRFRVTAVDIPGMGASDPLPEPPTLEGWASVMVDLMEVEGWDRVHLVGHHTGGYLAVEVAAQAPERVDKVVFSSTDVMDAAARATRVGRRGIDEVEERDDGTHLAELWQRRAEHYPRDNSLLRRFLKDALCTEDPEEGHRIVARYRMEDRLAFVTHQALCVGHLRDKFADGAHERLAAKLANARTSVIDDGEIPLEHTAVKFAAIVDEFLADA